MDMEDQGLIKIAPENKIAVDRLADCVNVILSYQNTQKLGLSRMAADKQHTKTLEPVSGWKL